MWFDNVQMQTKRSITLNFNPIITLEAYLTFISSNIYSDNNRLCDFAKIRPRYFLYIFIIISAIVKEEKQNEIYVPLDQGKIQNDYLLIQ